jgi:hypothetical protein
LNFFNHEIYKITIGIGHTFTCLRISAYGDSPIFVLNTPHQCVVAPGINRFVRLMYMR